MMRSKLDEGNKVKVITSYGAVYEGIVLRLTTYTVMLEVKHKRHPIEVEYKYITDIILEGEA